MIKGRPIENVLSKLNSLGINLRELDALEVFGKDGEWHTLDYSNKVNSLEIWEIDPKSEPVLHRNFPKAKIKIVDSYEEIKRANSKYSLIVIDNPMSNYGQYCEHFLLFPHVFRVCEESTTFIINVIPEIDERVKEEYPYVFNHEQLKCRSDFYKTDTPEKISFDHITETYKRLAEENNFEMEWSFFQRRNFVYYYVFHIRRL